MKVTYHNNKPNRLLIAEHLITPSPYGTHTLDGGNAIVGNEDLVDDPVAIEALDELLGGSNRQVCLVLTRQMYA